MVDVVAGLTVCCQTQDDDGKHDLDGANGVDPREVERHGHCL